MAIDPIWAGTIGALGGVALSGVFGLLTAKVSHGWQRQEQEDSRRHTRRAAVVEFRREAYVGVLVAWQRLQSTAVQWCESPKGAELIRRESDDRIRQYFADLRPELDAYGAAWRRATLLSGMEVEKILTSFDELGGDYIADLVAGADAESSFQRIDDMRIRLTQAMKSELNDLDEAV
jgi:hypothetical protein